MYGPRRRREPDKPVVLTGKDTDQFQKSLKELCLTESSWRLSARLVAG